MMISIYSAGLYAVYNLILSRINLFTLPQHFTSIYVYLKNCQWLNIVEELISRWLITRPLVVKIVCEPCIDPGHPSYWLWKPVLMLHISMWTVHSLCIYVLPPWDWSQLSNISIQMTVGWFVLYEKWFSFKLQCFLYPPKRSLGGVYWIHPVLPSVCPSVRPSVCPWVGVRMITLILYSGFKNFFLHISFGSRSCMGLNISVLPH